jgi:hypothetical protein
MRRTTRWTLAAGLAASALVSLACSSDASSPPAEHYPPRVALFGDSLSGEAQPYYTDLIHASGEVALTYDSYGGTAICDWLPKMREVAKTYRPAGVQLQFSGNALSPCMHGYAPPSEAYLEKYRADTMAAIDIFLPIGAHVYLIGGPVSRGSQPGWDALNNQYASIAAADPSQVTYVDAGTSVEGPDHTYVQELPCLPLEPCLGPVAGGVPVNVVRSPDGAHFCPVKEGNTEGVIGGCPVYSSGAYRYALAMVDAMAVPVSPS